MKTKRLKKIYPPHLKQTIQMEQILEQILNSLSTDLNSTELAESLHMNKKYFERTFQSHFEIPFHQFVKKLKLRAAAEMLYQDRTIKEHWQDYGYSSNISFSKAFSQEFGISPRDFVKTKCKIPDMPVKSQIWGTPITCEYYTIQERMLKGRAVPLMDGARTNRMEEVGYPYIYREQLAAMGMDPLRTEPGQETPDTRYGIWWLDKDGRLGTDHELYYLIAQDASEATDQDQIELELPEDYYAVFSFEKKENDFETALTMRLLARYVFQEWKKINRKTPNTIGMTFEWYGKERAGICVPILEKYQEQEENTTIGYGLDRWIVYINDHIREELTEKQLAQKAHYSEKSYREIFQLYYEMEPLVYIRRRRLYLAAEEIKAGADPHQVAVEYRFPSYEEFCHLFQEEFHALPDKLDSGLILEPVDLVDYFKEFKNTLQMRYCIKEPFCILGRLVSNPDEPANLSEQTCSLFRLNSIQYKKKCGAEAWKSYVQCAAWAEGIYADAGDSNYEYILGPVYPSMEQAYQSKEDLNREHRLIQIQGGRYAVFSTGRRSDSKDLDQTYRKMNRLAFYGWIRENMYRYDGERLTFVEYTSDKFYFYVPVKN